MTDMLMMVFNFGVSGSLNCIMYTVSHSKGMLYTPGIFSASSSFTSQRKLETFLSRRPTILIFQLTVTDSNGRLL
jgi:hypothetical protein